MTIKKIYLLISLFIVCIAATLVPYYLEYAEPYFAPSAINGINIFENGHIINSNSMKLAQRRLANDLAIEESYPLPGILTAFLIASTGLPYTKVAYIPIAGLGNLLYFSLARYILSNSSGYAILLSISYLILNISTRFHALITGRAVLGVIALNLFVISFIRLLESPKDKISPLFQWFAICLIATAMAGGTYYTATLGIIIIVIVSVLTPQNKFILTSSNIFLPQGSSVMVVAILLFFTPPILATLVPHLNYQQLFNHILDALYARLGMENTEMQGIFLEPDLLTKVRLWSLRIVILFSLLAPIQIIVSGILNKDVRNSRKWIYSIIVIGVCSTALPYLFKASLISTRFLVAYGFLCALSIVIQHLRYKIFSVLIVILVIVVAFSSMSFSLQKGGSFGAKPFAVNKTQPVSEYLSRNVVNGSIAVDAGYASNLWLLIREKRSNYDIDMLPLEKDAFALREAQNGSSNPLISILRRRNIDYLLLNTDGMPFYGDTWGYTIDLKRGPWLDSLPLNLIYDNSQFLLCRCVD